MPSQPLHDPTADPQPGAHTEVKTTTCYMCACRCGIRVHLRDGGNGPEVRYIEGNPEHPLNQGVLCAKGSAGIMKQYSPARLTQPLRRKPGSERGAGEFEPISWEETFALLTERLGDIRRTDPKKFALFTGRDQMQALTGLFARQFGTPNYAAHGGFCSVNMAAGMLYTIGGSFWEFGGPDVVRKLRRGQWQLQGQLDLHGLRREDARLALAEFIRHAHKSGWRCVRVIHGKGLGSPGKTPVLKNRVHSWLVQKKEVLAFVQARPADGGAGALVVLLVQA